MAARKFVLFYFLVGWFILSISPLCLAGDGNALRAPVSKDIKVMRTQGLINPGGNLKASYLLINEMRIYINGTTKIMDQDSKPIQVTLLKPKNWVYMEIEKDSNQKYFRAKKIYLLPHYVNSGEKKRYSFMK